MKNFNNVFTVSINANEYRIIQETVFELSMQETEKQMCVFDGTPKLSTWKMVDTDWLDHPSYNNLKTPDIAGFGATAIAICEHLVSYFSEKFKNSIELLPIRMNGANWYVLNVIATISAIDEDLTVRNMRNGRPSRTRLFKRLVLDRSKIDTEGGFNVEGAGMAVFCTDQVGGFYDTVQKNNLSGLVFTEVDVD